MIAQELVRMKFCRLAELQCLRYSTKPNSAVSAEFQSTGILTLDTHHLG